MNANTQVMTTAKKCGLCVHSKHSPRDQPSNLTDTKISTSLIKSFNLAYVDPRLQSLSVVGQKDCGMSDFVDGVRADPRGRLLTPLSVVSPVVFFQNFHADLQFCLQKSQDKSFLQSLIIFIINLL